jgi:hypothetical protein
MSCLFDFGELAYYALDDRSARMAKRFHKFTQAKSLLAETQPV